MKCDLCHENIPSFVVYEFNKGVGKNSFLCQSCALKLNIPEAIKQKDFPLTLFFEELLKKNGLPPMIKTPCQCGTYFEEIIESGKVGCPNCYVHFQELLALLLKNIFGQILYKGRIPKDTSKLIDLNQKKSLLENKLREAITLEEYEKAAYLRDEIQYINDEMDKNEKSEIY